MPAWLLPQQILLVAAPIAMLLSALALSAGERRAKARRAREALGAPQETLDAAQPGAHVVLDGTLHVLEGPCARFEDGRDAAATTVESELVPSHPHSALRWAQADQVRFASSARSTAMVLRSGKEDVLIEGPVEVAVGSDEMAPGAAYLALAKPVRERVERANGGATPELLTSDLPMGPLRFRSLADHVRVRAAGKLSKASDGARTGYREHAKWELVGTEEAPVKLAYAGDPRHRGSSGALLRGVRSVALRQVAARIAVAMIALVGLGYGATRHLMNRSAKGAASHAAAAHRGRSIAWVTDHADDQQRWIARCAEPRPTALPAAWTCVGELNSFTMYVPEDVGCVEDREFGCAADGFAGAHIRIVARHDADEGDVAIVERHGTEVEIGGVPALALRSHHAIRLLLEEDGSGVPHPASHPARLSLAVDCDDEQACRDAWLALQTIRLW